MCKEIFAVYVNIILPIRRLSEDGCIEMCVLSVNKGICMQLYGSKCRLTMVWKMGIIILTQCGVFPGESAHAEHASACCQARKPARYR